MRLHYLLTAKAASVALITATIALSTPASADSWQDAAIELQGLSSNRNLLSSELLPGDQAIGLELNGAVSFAGTTLEATSLDAVFGLSSDVAYVMVIEGSASARGRTAKPGRMLVLPAVGDNIELARFDAGLFKSSLASDAEAAHPRLIGKLEHIAARQSRGKWWGRFQTTGRNLNAARGADAERDRRALVSNPTMQQLRFAGLNDADAVARKTAESFVAALERGDREAVAALLDPTQFGDLGLRGGASAARSLAAEQLLNRVRPDGVSVSPGTSPSRWTFRTGDEIRTLELLQVDDLFFVSAVL